MIKLSSSDDDIGRAAKALLDGDLVAFPTETVYGLGALATDDRAVARIFALKGRPAFNPLIAHVIDRQAAAVFADLDERADELIKFFWPGPLTIVLPLKVSSAISSMVTAGLTTIAIRSPSHPVARQLLSRVELPVAAPSANTSGQISPTRAWHVAESLGDELDYLIEGGASAMGLESTVVDLTDAAQPGILLRPGSLPREDIEAVIGPLAEPSGKEAPKSPGMLARHYAPNKCLRLDVTEARPDEAVLAFGQEMPGGSGVCENLSENQLR